MAVRNNARLLRDALLEWEPERHLRLGQLLAQRTYLVVVSTPDLASAHRIFSVMNARGLDISPADVLKSDVIGQIRDDWRADYARKWEDAEEALGRAEFASLLLDIRMISSKRRAREELLKEFPKQVLARFGTAQMHSFIDDEIIPLSRAYCEIRDANYAPQDPGSAEINAWFRRLAQLDNGDWRAQHCGRCATTTRTINSCVSSSNAWNGSPRAYSSAASTPARALTALPACSQNSTAGRGSIPLDSS